MGTWNAFADERRIAGDDAIVQRSDAGGWHSQVVIGVMKGSKPT